MTSRTICDGDLPVTDPPLPRHSARNGVTHPGATAEIPQTELAAVPYPTPLPVEPPVPTVSVVIPTMDEGRNISWVLDRMPAIDELVIVDACSQDGTVSRVLSRFPDAVVISQPPRGKGAAMRAGFDAATQDVVIALDGDGSMDPQEIIAFVAQFRMGFDVVKGSRSACGGGSTDFTPLRRAGNRGLVRVYNTLFGAASSDLCYGFFGFRRSVLPALGLYADGFEIESQVMAHAQLAGLRIAEVPSMEAERLSGESHLRTFRDGSRALRALMRSRFSPGREYWRAMGVQARETADLATAVRDDSAPSCPRCGDGA